MDPVFKKAAATSLTWFPEHSWGYCPLDAKDAEKAYDDSYFQHYVDLEGSAVCVKINQARVDLVTGYVDGDTQSIVDIGIGSGTFLTAYRGLAYGYDVNPKGISWLKERKRFCDPYKCENESIHAITLWDVLEHIPDASELLRKVESYVFISMPIYTGAKHVLISKHFKKGEHCLYFTTEGLINWMRDHGFSCKLCDAREVTCGREDIGSFVFYRID